MRKLLIAGAILATALGSYAISQTVLNPAPVAAACAYNLTPPTPVSGQFYYIQCNSSGALLGN